LVSHTLHVLPWADAALTTEARARRAVTISIKKIFIANLRNFTGRRLAELIAKSADRPRRNDHEKNIWP
jgi:hypothetical protein